MAEDTFTLMEEREELMISPKFTQQLERRPARFLKPSLVTSIDDDGVQPFVYNRPQLYYSKLYVNFNGWRLPQKDWKAWVDRMHSLHQSTWKNAGIYEAVLNSSYEIVRDDDLILGLAGTWCHQTNSFVFVWGEATITLEDMMVLGGYSVLGQSVVTPPPAETENNQTILSKLEEARLELQKGKSNKAGQGGWLKKFKDSGSEIEHEAFLVFWLSRFVFPSSYSTVVKTALPIAVRLARGIRIALAPAVLATLYRDLSLLKAKIDDSTSTNLDDISVTVWAPLQLVQIWIWERLPTLMQNGGGDGCNPRFSRWYKKRLHIYNVGTLLDSALEKFSWRPYTGIHDLVSCNQEKGRWVGVGDCLDQQLESWVRCLRPSELVGIGGTCIQQYLPHRVAMQFGMDQDIPGQVPRNNASPETAWRFYTRPIRDVKLYLPSKFCNPCVTARYLEWWNKSVGLQARSSPSFMGNDEKLEIFVKNQSGIKESVDGNKASDESRSEGSKEFVDGNKASDESRSEGSKEFVDDTKTSDELRTGWSKGFAKGFVNAIKPSEVDSLDIDELIDRTKSFGSELKARIIKLEKIFAYLKAKKLGHRLT